MSNLGWTVSEERFFYEFLRASGGKNKIECAETISHVLGTKTKEDVLNFYDNAQNFLRTKVGKQEISSGKNLHSLLIKFYDSMIAPSRKKKQKKKASSLDLSPNSRHCLDGAPKLIENAEYVTPGTMGRCLRVESHEFIEILFVPYDDSLCAKLLFAKLNTCPKLQFHQSVSIVDVTKELERQWKEVISDLGIGGIRLHASEASPKALRHLSWGDPNYDGQTTLLDLLNALQVCTPTTLGYSWNSPKQMACFEKNVFLSGNEKVSTPQTFDSSLRTSQDPALCVKPEINAWIISQHDLSKKETGIDTQQKRYSNGSAVMYTPAGPPKERNQKRQRFKDRADHTISDANDPLEEEGILRKHRSNQNMEVLMSKGSKSASSLLENAIKQCNGTLRLVQDQLLRHDPEVAAYHSVQSFQPQIAQEWHHSKNRLPDFNWDASIQHLAGKEDSKFGTNLLEALDLPLNMDELKYKDEDSETPRKIPRNYSILGANKCTLLSPPYSHVPSRLHSPNHLQNGTPSRSLKNVFDSCHAKSPFNTASLKQAPCETQKDMQHSLLDILNNTNLSLLSLFENISNSNWMSNCEVEQYQDEQEAVHTSNEDSRPFADLFG